MAENEKAQLVVLLRSFELRLLRCSIPSDNPTQASHPPSSQPSNSHLHVLIENLLQLIESGQYIQALSSDATRTLFDFKKPIHLSSVFDSADRVYNDWAVQCVELFLLGGDSKGEEEYKDGEMCCRAFIVMAVAVAALLAFTQCNITGPIKKFPLMPMMGLYLDKEGNSSADLREWEVWAHKELILVGSDMLGKFSNLQYIVFAKILITRIKDLLLERSIYCMDGVRSISWWLARILLLQQRLLDERSSSLFDLLLVFTRESLDKFGSVEKIISYWGTNLREEEASAIASMLHLELGIMEHIYGRIDSSRLHFESAELASGLHLSVSGALGFRTVHQVEPKAQLLLVPYTSTSNGGDTYKLEKNVSNVGKYNLLKHRREICEASDILMTPRFLEDDKNSESSAQCIQYGGVAATPLKAVQQAVILAQCLSIGKRSRHDEMQWWEMAPYIEAIDSQHSSPLMIRFFCDILRIRWESTRSHTKQRALVMLDKLVQGVCETSSGVAQRIYYCYGVNIPTIPALRKEYGDLLVSCGLVGEAVEVYEDLELWDNLIYCYRLLEKKAAAVDLIKTRLSERPSDPRLWCSLGDVTNNDACYEKALEVSENRSARAKRSLARSAYNRGDYKTSKILWESAMALNSLYPDGWFALGAAALKARDVEKALDGFTRAIQLDPENGEAWNNIACLHMINKKSKEASIAFKEALKFKRNSWQLWENYGYVGVDIGDLYQAMEAVRMVLELSNNKRADDELLKRMMLKLESQVLTSHSQSPVANNNDDFRLHIHDDSDLNYVNESTDSELDLARTRETKHLMELFGNILQRIVRSGGGAEMWGLYARWHKLKGDLTMCSEALLKQVRSYQGSDLWKDQGRFKKFAHASLELCAVYMELACHNGSRRELLAAEMHLKNTIKQAENFSETEEFRDLQAYLQEVQRKMQDSPGLAA